MRVYSAGEMNPNIWDVLHDGSIECIAGAVPGNVELTISIIYLRERFSDVGGDSILVTLRDCAVLEYKAWDSDKIVTDFSSIMDADLEILGAGELGVVACAEGELRVSASGFSLALDSGRVISFDELSTVAREYWDEFGRTK